MRHTDPDADFDGPTVPFFSKMYDFFAAKETYLDKEDAYADATGTENPFKNGRPTGQRLRFTRTVRSPKEHTITSTFNPSEPTDVCRAWTSLATYCGDVGKKCACYSGTYYVPDQWNSLAAGCAVLTTRCSGTDGTTKDPWCEIGKTASDYTNYCTDDPAKLRGTSIVKFAARANIKTPVANPAPDATPTRKPAATTQASGGGGKIGTERIIVESTSIQHLPLPSTPVAPTNPVQSWSSRSRDFVTANRYSWILLAMALIFFI